MSRRDGLKRHGGDISTCYLCDLQPGDFRAVVSHYLEKEKQQKMCTKCGDSMMFASYLPEQRRSSSA